MKDYSEMSDNEINQCMTAVVDGCENWCLSDDESCFYDCGIDGNQFYEVKIKDYCNNPSDAWPIIDDIFSTLVSIGKYDDGIGFGEREMTIWQAQMHKNNCGKLRAAMIVFLMMNEGK